MKLKLDENWTTTNNGYPLNDAEVARYNAVLPSQRQILQSQNPFYCFIHYGMNTATGREWGNATETLKDFDITKIKPVQWVKAIKASGASGIILTCKHHDGFCLWDTKQTDFNVMNTTFGIDIVKAVSDECRLQDMKFGVYLSPWDMHEKCYATEQYNDYFCAQLTELLTNYGEIFEVWFDGAKGAGAKAFEYDWERYYALIRELQPKANIAVCGPDVRWVGNEAGKCRKSEFSVVPSSLTLSEAVQKKSQQTVEGAKALQNVKTGDEDLGSRAVLKKADSLCWYPAEVDVSIRKGWFNPGGGTRTVKSANKLFNIYKGSVGNNCYLLLNVPPCKEGTIQAKDAMALKSLGEKIKRMTQNAVIDQKFGALKDTDGYLEFNFDTPKKLKYAVLSEDIAYGQRIEKFDLYLKRPNGRYKKAYSGTIVGMKKIIKLRGKASGAILVIRQSRSNPIIKQIAFYD